jgi:ferric-dicitrate binding protein FerR (iron transport regulator)
MCHTGKITNKMKHDIPWKELNRYFLNKNSQRETLRIENWKKQEPVNAEIFEQLKTYFDETGMLPLHFKPNKTRALRDVSDRISAAPNKKRVQIHPVLWKTAAAVVLCIGLGWLVNQYTTSIKTTNYANVITTTDSTQTEIVLPDSSHVWLNSGSSIKYPEKFGENREIKLEGEAYFEIAHDTAHPFIVYSGNTQTRVLGTKFNLRAYASDKQVALHVTQGKVSFGSKDGDKQLFTHGQMGTYNIATGKVLKSENADSNFLAWKTHEFYFDNHSLASVFEILSNVYHFKYKFENDKATTIRITASFNNRPLPEIMQTITASSNISITLKNGIYTIQ